MAKGNDTYSNFIALQNKIKSGEFSPIYLLQGEEVYFIDALCDLLEQSILPEAERSFNQSIIYGKEIKMNDLVSMARRYPMMSKYQVIIIKEAKDLKEWDKFEAYAGNPVQSTILVFCLKNGKLDLRSKTAKIIQSKFSFFQSDKLRDYQLKQWVQEKVKSQSRSIDAAAIEMLLDFVGDDLSTLNNELDKLLITVKDDFIRATHVESNVGVSRKYSVFEFQKALGQKNFSKSVQIANYLANDMAREDYFPFITILHKFFTKITQVHTLAGQSDNTIASAIGVNPFFVGDYTLAARNFKIAEIEKAIHELKLFDLRLKGMHRGNASDGQLFIEAIVRILRN
jgi:DNA polymerase-3 subunit delta